MLDGFKFWDEHASGRPLNCDWQIAVLDLDVVELPRILFIFGPKEEGPHASVPYALIYRLSTHMLSPFLETLREYQVVAISCCLV